MLNNKKIFFYSVFVLNIIFFIKSADLSNTAMDLSSDMEPDDIFKDIKGTIDNGILDPKITMGRNHSNLVGSPMDVDKDNGVDYKIAGDWAVTFPDYSENWYKTPVGVDHFPASDNLDTLMNGEDVSGNNYSLDHNGSDEVAALPSNGSFPSFSDALGTLHTHGYDVSYNDSDLNVLINKINRHKRPKKLTVEDLKLLDELSKKAASGSKLTETEKQLLSNFFNYGCNSQDHRNLLFEKIPGQKYSYKFKNGEGIISVRYNDDRELVCDCGFVMDSDAVTMHMINHSKLREAIGYKKCLSCKIPFYFHPKSEEAHKALHPPIE